MHVDEFTRLIGALFIIAAIGAAAWIGAQVVPQVQAVAVMPAKIEAENARLASVAEIERAQAQEKIKTLPTLTALDVQAKQAAIDAERTRVQAQASAQLIEAQGKADGARAQGQAFVILAGAFVLACVLVVGYFVLREAMSARNFRQVIEIAAREGGRLELPNGHAVLFPTQAQRAQIGAPQIAGALGVGSHAERGERASVSAPIDARQDRA
jgi:hypothetical protein